MTSIYSRDRRRFVRYKAKGKALIKIAGSTINAELDDISYTGIGIISSHRTEPDTDISFELKTEFYTKPIKGQGKVKVARETYVKGSFKIGIEFTKIDTGAIETTLHGIQRQVALEKKKARAERKSVLPDGFSYF